MEGKAEFTSNGVTVTGVDAPDGYLVAARTAAPAAPENPTTQVEGPSMAALPPVNVPASSPPSAGDLRKKRGRPRKYRPDCSFGAPLSPIPISAIPHPGDFPAWKQEPTTRLKPNPAVKRASRLEIQTAGDRLSFLSGRDFTPHMITVNAGQDVAMKILSFCQDYRAISVISANGWISNVTIRRPDAVGGTVTYEGRFEIVSLYGSFMPIDNGLLRSRCGGLSVTLVDAEGKTIAGGLAGLLIAASDVLVTMASFLPSHSNQRKPKKAKAEPSSAPVPTMAPPRDKEPTDDDGGQVALPRDKGPIDSNGGLMAPPHDKQPTVSNGGQMAPPRDKGPIDSNGGQTLDFSSPPSNQANPSASHNKDLGTRNKLSALTLEGELNGNGQPGFMTSG